MNINVVIENACANHVVDNAKLMEAAEKAILECRVGDLSDAIFSTSILNESTEEEGGEQAAAGTPGMKEKIKAKLEAIKKFFMALWAKFKGALNKVKAKLDLDVKFLKLKKKAIEEGASKIDGEIVTIYPKIDKLTFADIPVERVTKVVLGLRGAAKKKGAQEEITKRVNEVMDLIYDMIEASFGGVKVERDYDAHKKTHEHIKDEFIETTVEPAKLYQDTVLTYQTCNKLVATFPNTDKILNNALKKLDSSIDPTVVESIRGVITGTFDIYSEVIRVAEVNRKAYKSLVDKALGKEAKKEEK